MGNPTIQYVMDYSAAAQSCAASCAGDSFDSCMDAGSTSNEAAAFRLDDRTRSTENGSSGALALWGGTKTLPRKN
mgnify:CR=1 FL=1